MYVYDARSYLFFLENGEMMKTIVDVRTLLKSFGVFVYTRSRIGDLDLIESEVRDLYSTNLIEQKEYSTCILIIRTEKSKLM